MLVTGISRRKFFTECSIKLYGASVLLSHYCAKPVFASQEELPHKKQKDPAMEYRTLGRTDLKVSVVSHGLAQLKEPAFIFKALDLGIKTYEAQ